jgi:RNA polymerase sigma factor (sigma-70 family)
MTSLGDGEQRALLEQARSGSRQALARLLDDFRGPAMAAIHKTLAACGVDGAHTEEAFQQATFKFIARGLSAYRGGAAPRSYFTRIAINAALDVTRRLARVAHGGVDERRPELERLREPSAEERLSLAERRQALQICVEKLPEKYRRTVELYYLEEAGDCATCAELLGVSKAAFMQQLCRARAMLAQCLGRRLR